MTPTTITRFAARSRPPTRRVKGSRLGVLGGAGPSASDEGGVLARFGTAGLVKIGGNRGRASEGRNHAGIRELISDVGTGMIGGYVGTQVMERVSMKLYELESEEDRNREEEVRPGPPFYIAARKVTEGLGLNLSEEQLQKVATYVFHYGLGIGWGPPYTFLRRWTDLGPVSAGLLTGAAMSLIVDEGMTPLFGFSAPNRDYPLSTHLRGFAAHLAFGLGVAATSEAIRWLGSHGRRQEGKSDAMRRCVESVARC